MGLLDDAIREHLDLKRRRGADPAEVERAEREALGPVRRNRDPGDEAEPQDQIPAGGFAYDQDDDYEWGAETRADTQLADPRGDLVDDLDEDDAWSAPASRRESESMRPESLGAPREETAPLEDWSATEDDEFSAEPFSTTSGSTRRPADVGGDETTEYNVEDVLSPTDGEADEDMLEETPEFLQDTPDHDRLWFEQRPPRDFDFDE
jgi:hypothetical protein